MASSAVGSATLSAPESSLAARDPAQLQLLVNAEAPGLARQAMRAVLARWRLANVVEPACLIVSELVTNAVRHARGKEIQLRITQSAVLLIEVHDNDSRLPFLRQSSLLDGSGRGLVIVEATARRWGAHPTASGKAVWAELSIEERRAGAPPDSRGADARSVLDSAWQVRRKGSTWSATLRSDRSVVVVSSDGQQLNTLVREFTIAMLQGRGPEIFRAMAADGYLASSPIAATECAVAGLVPSIRPCAA